MIFRMGVPFAQITNGSLTRRPSRQRDGFVAKRHSLEQVAKPLVPYCGSRRLLNEHVTSVNRAEQKPPSFAVGITGLNMLTERLQRGLRKMQQRPLVVGCPRTHELHRGHSRSRSGSQSGVASCWVPSISLVRSAGEETPLTQSSAISATRLAACTDTEAGNGTYKPSHPCPAKMAGRGSTVERSSPLLLLCQRHR